MRILKEHDVRKAEILDAAQALFFESGYDQTSVSAIIDKVGVAKGTFYYYFKSKEDLLDCLAERAGEQSMAEIEAVATSEGLNALEKLNLVYDASRRWQSQNMDLVMTILKAMYKDENLLLRHKIQTRGLEMSTPLFSDIIAQGVKEGLFDVEDPREIGELVLRMGNDMSNTATVLFLDIPNNPGNLDRVERKIEVYQDAVARILGAPKGSIRILDKEFIREFARKYFFERKQEPKLRTGLPRSPLSASV